MAVKMCFQSFYLAVMTNLQTWLRRTVKISVDYKKGSVKSKYYTFSSPASPPVSPFLLFQPLGLLPLVIRPEGPVS